MRPAMLYFNLISLLLIVCGAAVLGAQTPDIAASARVYPIVLIVLVVVCSLAVAAKEFVGRATTAPLDSELGKILRAPAAFRYRFLGFAAIWLIYPWAFSRIGFIVATTGAISVSLWLLQVKRPLVGVLAAFLFAVVFSLLFATVLYIPMPAGPLDELLTRLLYAIQH